MACFSHWPEINQAVVCKLHERRFGYWYCVIPVTYMHTYILANGMWPGLSLENGIILIGMLQSIYAVYISGDM